jgi:hypothetical protein
MELGSPRMAGYSDFRTDVRTIGGPLGWGPGLEVESLEWAPGLGVEHLAWRSIGMDGERLGWHPHGEFRGGCLE